MMTDKSSITARELALDMLMEILEKGSFCHIVERQALSEISIFAETGKSAGYQAYRRGH